MPPPVPWPRVTLTHGGHPHNTHAATRPLPLGQRAAVRPFAPPPPAGPPPARGGRPLRRSVVQPVSSRADFVALLNRLGILGRWDELADLDVTVRVLGSVFDREGYPVGSVSPYPEDEELTVCFYKQDIYLGAILLADLCRLAAATPDALPRVGR